MHERKQNLYIPNDKVSGLLFLFLAFLFVMMTLTKNCFSAALTVIVSNGVMTKAQTGLITSGFYILYGPLQIVGGVLADRYNPRNLIAMGVIGSVIANFVIFFNHNFYVMLIAWSLNGAAQMGIYPAIFKMISARISYNWRRKAIYYFSFTQIIGQLFAFVLAAFIKRWEYNFLFSAVSSSILLVALFVAFKYATKYMVPEEKIEDTPKEEVKSNLSTFKLFLISGFIILLPMRIFKDVINQSVRLYTPTMMMESYQNLNPTISNLLNVFVLISGTVGTIVMRKILFKKERNEVLTILLAALTVIPFILLIKFTGSIHYLVILIALCFSSAILSSMTLPESFISSSFAKFGKSATAAGILNGASSLGIVLQSYGLGYIADHFGWNTVTTIYVVFIGITVVLMFTILPLWTKFKKKYL